MKNIFLPITALLAALAALTGCKEETFTYQTQQAAGEAYNPSLPVVITGFMPDSGKLREKILITGSNFGNDKEKVQVFFNDGLDKKATVISVDGTNIYCLAPRQSAGPNKIKVKIAGASDTLVAPKPFSYKAVANVSWVAGVGTRDGIGAKYNDGTLAEANFWKIHGIVALKDEQIMTFGFYEGSSNNVRLISIQDDKVITVQNGVYHGKPAFNESKTRVYATTLNVPHKVYEYKKESGWMPYQIGEITNLGTSTYDRIRCLSMMDKAHDPNEEWLYFCHRDKIFGRFNVNTLQTEVLGTNLDLPTVNWGGYLLYDKFNDCFYVSLYEVHSIYKIAKTGDSWGGEESVTVELFAGSPSRTAVADGLREDASFTGPLGMCMDEYGDIYLCDGATDINGGSVVRKISAADGYVLTVAGRVGVREPRTDGDPAEAILFFPYDISYDDEGGFYIAEWWEACVTKYAVE